MKLTKLAAAGVAVVAFFALAPVASAQNSVITGVSTSSLSLTVPATVVSAGLLTPGSSTVFTASSVAVVDPAGTWTLNVKDSSSTTPGILKKTGDSACVTGAAANTGSALTFAGDAAEGTDGSGTLSGSDAAVASGSSTNFADTVSVVYTQPTIPAGTNLPAGCPYAVTVVYTIS